MGLEPGGGGGVLRRGRRWPPAGWGRPPLRSEGRLPKPERPAGAFLSAGLAAPSLPLAAGFYFFIFFYFILSCAVPEAVAAESRAG